MIDSIASAKEYLEKNSLTFCAIKDGEIYTSDKSGIAPILSKMDGDIMYFSGATILDKVIGKAAAMLLAKSNATKIYALLISDEAIKVLEKEKIPYEYEKRVPYIKNRGNTGLCPMEQVVLGISDLDEAFRVLREKVKSMIKNK